MLSDMQANDVMGMIESFIEHADRGHENCILMLDHLYELHKHRDDEVYNELCYLIVKEGLPIYSQLWNALAEMQTC